MSLKTDNIQIGNNPTTSQNFVLSQAADGTGKLSRQSGGDIITWDAAGKVTFPLPPIQTQYSMVRLNTANGYGSTNTKIRRFTNIVTNVGSDITYADSIADGASFVINTAGIYCISYTDQFSAATWMGISLDSSQLTTVISTITQSNILDVVYLNTANQSQGVSLSAYLPASSVIRAHTDGISTGTSTTGCHFTLTRVG